ncbi:MAG: formylmethanofuran dehydrogenase subunit [Gammaproteobacteria bacterium]|nr:formylmethanofuran dehydrogenase subunit [Gammaproteobacteria bacterium]
MIDKNNVARIHRNVTCPFCSLLCDDLVVKNKTGQLKVLSNGCSIAKSQFEQTQLPVKPGINGKEVTLDDAINHVINIFRKSRQPLIAGLGTDVAGMRAVMELADKTGAIVDHMYSDGAMRNIKVMQDHGWMMTTMAEIKNRADLIIFAGTDGITNYPRFYERVIWNKNSLFNIDIKQREIVYIGDHLNTSAGKNPSGRLPTSINCKQEQISEIVATLHAMIVGNKIQEQHVAGVKLQVLEKLAERMKQARYGVIVWAPGELNHPHAELTIQAICQTIKYLNRTTRFSGFSLAGNDGGITAGNVSAWLSGYPLRVSFAKGYPEYDPYKYTIRNVLNKKEVDTLIWISSFTATVRPPKANIPTVVLATPATKLHFRPEVIIPVGTPGVDHGGQLFRTDSVIALPLKQVRTTKYLNVAEILNRVVKSL